MRALGLLASDPLLRRQGAVFCLLAGVGLAGTPWLTTLNDQALLGAVALAILFLGLPHGALDTVFAKKLYRVGTPWQWLLFTVAYLVLAALVVLAWYQMPRLFFAVFLLISAWHFSGDPVIALPSGARILYGSAVIVLPSLLHGAQVTALFAHLIGLDAAGEAVALLRSLGVPLLIGEVLLFVIAVRVDWLAGVEILCVVLLSLFATPLVAFTLFFCGMHSPRHFLRAASLAGMRPGSLLLQVAMLPTLACLIAAAYAMHAFTMLPVEARLMRIVFVGLAALTVPHMLLVERVRLREWQLAG